MKSAVRIQRATEELAWDERDDSDQLSSNGSATEEECDEALSKDNCVPDETQIGHVKTPARDRKCKKTAAIKTHDCSFSGQMIYPHDVWFILSKYIFPSEVRTFALICRGTNVAVNSNKFWLRLYHHHVKKVKLLPDCLKPNRIDCRPGLRARVVRALFHSYEPLSSQLRANSGLSDELLNSVELQTCTSAFWKSTISQKPKKTWTVKFADKWALQHKISTQLSADWIMRGDFLNENSELGRSFLQVNCPNFMVTPPINGLVLTSICIGISHDMRHSSVKMVYHTPRSDGRFRKEDGVLVTLDPASDFRVLPWWHPLYPYPS